MLQDAPGGGFASRASGIFGSFTIPNGVAIGNADGGSGHDTLLGKAAGKVLREMAGNDRLRG